MKLKIWPALPQGNEPQSSLIRVFVSIGSHVREQHTTLRVETLIIQKALTAVHKLLLISYQQVFDKPGIRHNHDSE